MNREIKFISISGNYTKTIDINSFYTFYWLHEIYEHFGTNLYNDDYCLKFIPICEKKYDNINIMKFVKKHKKINEYNVYIFKLQK